jgi:hypothetical protein
VLRSLRAERKGKAVRDVEPRDEKGERVAEAVRRALALVGPADSTAERASDQRTARQPVA